MLPKPMVNRSNPNKSDAIKAMSTNSSADLRKPEIICATTYSDIDSGVMNMLVRLRDQIFQSAPTDIEYCVTRMISHMSVPMYRYCATVGLLTVDKKRVTKPKTT